ncbi:MAG: glycosyltransferase, partial [Muribaculaceae bacterium]|nr:glycosyltransferase [Muribaculaceae bacterium]
MDCPLISVIIPIYKTEATLSRTIESVLSQSFDDYELVLVDDGTPDGAGAIADDYASRYSHIHVVHQENRGLAEAR